MARIEFVEKTHTYLVDGVIVPSVTEILEATIFKGKYDGIPYWILEEAARFGTTIHKSIQFDDYSDLTDEELHCIKEYLKLVRTANIDVVAHEQVVHHETEYAGTFDMEAWVNNELSLCDIKTTYVLDVEYISWQLSMYELARGKKYQKLYAIWLPKKKEAKLVEVKRKSKSDIMRLLRIYRKVAHEQSISFSNQVEW